MKIVGLKLKYEEWSSKDKLTISSNHIDIQKETTLLYKLGNDSGLMFGCRSQIQKSEIGNIFFGYDCINDHACNNIYLTVCDICEENDVETKIQEWKIKLCEFAKEELNNRMDLLSLLQDQVKILINKTIKV